MNNKPKEDLSNRRFGRWVAVRYVGKSRWLCKCDCGCEREIPSNRLTSGLSKSCGCYKRELTIQRNITHGWNKTPLHSRWLDIKDRCYNPNNSEYNRYGGRGICVCDEWRNNFSAFKDWALENGFQKSLTIDRIDNDGDYEPGNCRWVDRATQSRNTSRNHYLTVNGRTQTVMDWAKEKGLNESVIRRRILRGWSDERSVNTPARPIKRKAAVMNENRPAQ